MSVLQTSSSSSDSTPNNQQEVRDVRVIRAVYQQTRNALQKLTNSIPRQHGQQRISLKNVSQIVYTNSKNVRLVSNSLDSLRSETRAKQDVQLQNCLNGSGQSESLEDEADWEFFRQGIADARATLLAWAKEFRPEGEEEGQECPSHSRDARLDLIDELEKQIDVIANLSKQLLSASRCNLDELNKIMELLEEADECASRVAEQVGSLCAMKDWAPLKTLWQRQAEVKVSILTHAVAKLTDTSESSRYRDHGFRMLEDLETLRQRAHHEGETYERQPHSAALREVVHGLHQAIEAEQSQKSGESVEQHLPETFLEFTAVQKGEVSRLEEQNQTDKSADGVQWNPWTKVNTESGAVASSSDIGVANVPPPIPQLALSFTSSLADQTVSPSEEKRTDLPPNVSQDQPISPLRHCTKMDRISKTPNTPKQDRVGLFSVVGSKKKNCDREALPDARAKGVLENLKNDLFANGSLPSGAADAGLGASGAMPDDMSSQMPKNLPVKLSAIADPVSDAGSADTPATTEGGIATGGNVDSPATTGGGGAAQEVELQMRERDSDSKDKRAMDGGDVDCWATFVVDDGDEAPSCCKLERSGSLEVCNGDGIRTHVSDDCIKAQSSVGPSPTSRFSFLRKGGSVRWTSEGGEALSSREVGDRLLDRNHLPKRANSVTHAFRRSLMKLQMPLLLSHQKHSQSVETQKRGQSVEPQRSSFKTLATNADDYFSPICVGTSSSPARMFNDVSNPHAQTGAQESPNLVRKSQGRMKHPTRGPHRGRASQPQVKSGLHHLGKVVRAEDATPSPKFAVFNSR